jgi:hypothetical protein
MKAITICQPWAELIACGKKRVENRRWRTRYRGPIAIHAGLSRRWFGTTTYFTAEQCEDLPRGVIVAVAELVDCIRIDELSRGRFADPELQEYAYGPHCWILERVRRLDSPIRAIGQQRLWDFEGLSQDR